MTQTELLLNHLQQNGSITVPEAKATYKLKHLAARIKELRDDGYVISHTTYKEKDMYGVDQKHSRYTLLGHRTEENKKEPCKGCLYWRPLGNMGQSIYACHYLLETGHMRGCPPGEGCTKYIRKKD